VAFAAIAFFRRYAMKPMPAKPRIIIAQVAGGAFFARKQLLAQQME
jgi:hypothetical protein